MNEIKIKNSQKELKILKRLNKKLKEAESIVRKYERALDSFKKGLEEEITDTPK